MCTINRIKQAHLVAFICSILCFFYITPSEARGRFSTEPVSPHYFYWLIISTLSFLQGAFNGLFMLILRTYKFKYAGERWTLAFWSGFLIALLNCTCVSGLIEYVHDGESLREQSWLLITFWLVLYLTFNLSMSTVMARWAAKETEYENKDG